MNQGVTDLFLLKVQLGVTSHASKIQTARSGGPAHLQHEHMVDSQHDIHDENLIKDSKWNAVYV